MTRSFVDDDLQTWEVWASSGRRPERARIVFQCVPDRGRRPRLLSFPGSHAEAERDVCAADPAQLKTWLADAQELD